MALPPTATDMPQNELYENQNLGITKLNRGIGLTTGEYQICCATADKFILRAQPHTHLARQRISENEDIG
jgi:hypothetical protein